jgi:hypothetical protein
MSVNAFSIRVLLLIVLCLMFQSIAISQTLSEIQKIEFNPSPEEDYWETINSKYGDQFYISAARFSGYLDGRLNIATPQWWEKRLDLENHEKGMARKNQQDWQIPKIAVALNGTQIEKTTIKAADGQSVSIPTIYTIDEKHAPTYVLQASNSGAFYVLSSWQDRRFRFLRTTADGVVQWAFETELPMGSGIGGLDVDTSLHGMIECKSHIVFFFSSFGTNAFVCVDPVNGKVFHRVIVKQGTTVRRGIAALP